MRSASITAFAGVLLFAPSHAAFASSASPTTKVAELVVPGGPPPKLVTSFPADGGEVAAGALVIKLVFDQPMTADGWSYGRSGDAEFPACLAKPRLLADGRTFALLCTVAAHKAYALEVNAAPAFTGANGRLAKPSRLSFTTTDTAVLSLHDALEQAGLTEADEPIMTWRDPGVGVSKSLPPSAP